MKIEDYIAGKKASCFQYECFVPEMVNHSWEWKDSSLTISLEQAIKSLSALNSSAQFVPDIGLFIRMHVVREASASSRIEGTQTEMEEVVLPEEAVVPEHRDDWREVNNYVAAMDEIIRRLDELPLSMRLLRTAHERLLSGVRGKNKMPGEIRTSQNWIGGTSISTARFIPPAPEYLPDLLSDLEFFWHNEKIAVPNLIRAAITHYQFETIHPFLDGNGRIGRLLIPFFLINCGDLEMPSLYISSYLEAHRDAYYSALSGVRERNDLMTWIKFFLDAVKVTSEQGCETFRKIFAFRDNLTSYCASKGVRGGNLLKVIRFLYLKPRSNISEIESGSGVDYRTANRCVKELTKDGWLRPFTDAKRNCIYDFYKYLDVFK